MMGLDDTSNNNILGDNSGDDIGNMELELLG